MAWIQAIGAAGTVNNARFHALPVAGRIIPGTTKIFMCRGAMLKTDTSWTDRIEKVCRSLEVEVVE